ncbi:MAG TPA: tetratricopeptide repeat protein, partial [Polyangia bacterium]
ALAVAVAARAGATPWEEVAHPNRRRCLQLVADATTLADGRQWKSAAQAARTAASLCPSDRNILQHAGETLLGAREYAEGRQDLERAHRLVDAPATHDDELSLAFLLGFAREVTGDLDGAIDEHRRLEAMGGLPPPNQYLVHYNLGDELMAAGRLGEAIDEYRRAVTLAGAKPVVRLALAVALDRDEQVDQARAELAGVLAFDPDLRSLDAEDYVFVPRAEIYYYRALALAERGALAEARLDLRHFLAELPTSPYAAHARRRLVDAEERVDPRELEVSAAGVDSRAIARALDPVVAALESCLPGAKVMRVRLQLARGALHAEPDHPAAECLDRALSRVDARSLAALHAGSVVLPLAARRPAPSAP